MNRRRSLLFYSGWGLGYHNPEAERKAAAFARAGYDVAYVAGLGIRNPRLSSAPKLVSRVRAKLAPSMPSASPPPPGVRSVALAVVPPRQQRVLRRVNAAWLGRQVRGVVPSWQYAVAWIRWPTPELVDWLKRDPPAALVYECVDAYDHTPGITGRWEAIFRAAEDELVALADAVVVPGPALAERFSGRARVVTVPHGTELFSWTYPPPRNSRPITAGFVGTLDYRLDMAWIRRIAEERPDWRVHLAGPHQEGFSPRELRDLANVELAPPVAFAELGPVLAGFDVGVMPYRDHPHVRSMTPVKNLELMAAGRPAVARPSPALEQYAEWLYFARTADQFVAQAQRAVDEDSLERARARRAVAESSSWERREADLIALLEELEVGPGERTPA
ncbi:MAG: glycosyltransferase [Actinomycetota bacterium]|nr:glycosyltransferase [Actinomycetota bacterium]